MGVESFSNTVKKTMDLVFKIINCFWFYPWGRWKSTYQSIGNHRVSHLQRFSQFFPECTRLCCRRSICRPKRNRKSKTNNFLLSIYLLENCRSKISVRVPPVRRARCWASSTKHTLIKTIENCSFFRRLGILLICNWLEISAR